MNSLTLAALCHMPLCHMPFFRTNIGAGYDNRRNPWQGHHGGSTKNHRAFRKRVEKRRAKKGYAS